MKLSISSLAKACFRFSSLALVVGGLFTSAQASTNLITNGDFESTTAAPAINGTFGNASTFTNILAGASFIDNWTYSTTEGPAAYIRDDFGNHFIQMGANNQAGGVLSQIFDAPDNQTFDVSFDITPIGSGGSTLKVSVSDSGNVELGSINVSLASGGIQNFSFTTGSNATGLRFTVKDTTPFTTTGNDNDLGIDNISVTQSTSAIPETSTYAAIFGLLALGAATFRRRQSRA